MQNNGTTDMASFRFLIIKCRDCGFDFTVTPSQQRWLLERALSIPSHCPSCLLQRKLAKKIEEQAANNGQRGGNNGS
jgi:predicted Zn-ribbon and HTH transcriptional regulator